MMKPADYGGTSRETCAVCAVAHLVTLCGLRAHPSRQAHARKRATACHAGCYALRPPEVGTLFLLAARKRGAAKRKSDGRKDVPPAGLLRCQAQRPQLRGNGHTLGGQHIRNGGENALLPVARQLADFLEDQTRLARWPIAALTRRRLADQRIYADSEQLCQNRQLFRSHGNWFAFPKRISPSGDAQRLRYLRLRQSRCFTQRVKPRPEWWPRPVTWSTRLHANTVTGV